MKVRSSRRVSTVTFPTKALSPNLHAKFFSAWLVSRNCDLQKGSTCTMEMCNSGSDLDVYMHGLKLDKPGLQQTWTSILNRPVNSTKSFEESWVTISKHLDGSVKAQEECHQTPVTQVSLLLSNHWNSEFWKAPALPDRPRINTTS
ncbi:hypothetical protein VNO77_04535 [Canavalia gladiata]|uniref:Uncharacterized protein n=1 Tax=Canavalia gladiata TaxID=3824 RepID=A0AAN9N374_CANGL